MTKPLHVRSSRHKHYKLLADLGEVVVPDDFNQDTYLDTFRAAHERSFYLYCEALTSANFVSATVRLEPGRRFGVTCYRVANAYSLTEPVTGDDNIQFLASKGSVLTGAHGAALVWQQKRDLLPKGRWYLSYDEKKALWKDRVGYLRVPLLIADVGSDFCFNLDRFVTNWHDAYVLLVFRDVPLPV